MSYLQTALMLYQKNNQFESEDNAIALSEVAQIHSKEKNFEQAIEQ